MDRFESCVDRFSRDMRVSSEREVSVIVKVPDMVSVGG